MYTYRISITSDIADIEGTFSQEAAKLAALRVEVLATNLRRSARNDSRQA